MRCVIPLILLLAFFDACAQTAPGELSEPYQDARFAPLFERNPIHPAHLSIYGRLVAGYLHSADDPTPLDACRQNDEPHKISRALVDSRTRSFVGFRGHQTLSSGYVVSYGLEHSLKPNTGGAEDCAHFWNARASVGLEHRDMGRVELGRRDQPAWLVSLAADPWNGNTVASPSARLYFPIRRGETRTSGSVTYTSPVDRTIFFEVQAGRDPDGSSNAEYGGRLVYERARWTTAVGYQRWSRNWTALPMSAMFDPGGIRFLAGLTLGTADARRYTTSFIGVVVPVMAKGDPLRHEMKFGLARFDSGHISSDAKLGVGYRYRLSRRTSLSVDAALVRKDSSELSRGVEVSLAHSFDRDLRFPQELR